MNSVAASAGTGDAALGNNAVNFAFLFVLQFVALLPTLFKKKLAAYEQKAF